MMNCCMLPFDVLFVAKITHLELAEIFCFTSWAVKDIEGFVTDIYGTMEMRGVCHDAFMQH